MNKYLLILLTTLFLYLNIIYAGPSDKYYQVTKVIDGDSIHVLDAQGTRIKVRLAYIDAPELKQDFGQESKKALESMLNDQYVDLEIVNKDRYGRTVARVLMDNIDINLQMIANGMAWHYVRYDKQPIEKFLIYQQAMRKAKAIGMGLWSGLTTPIEPWKYRLIPKINECCGEYR